MPRKGKNHGPQKPIGGIHADWFKAGVKNRKKRSKIAKQSRRKNR